MKERLLRLLELEQLTPSKFADLIGVQRSSVSHVISGRNNPSYDFLQKTLKSFPGLRADWIMLGEGPMYEKMGREETGDLFDAIGGDLLHTDRDRVDQDKAVRQDLNADAVIESAAGAPDSGDLPVETDVIKSGGAEKGRKAVQVMILYDDDTFESYRPNH